MVHKQAYIEGRRLPLNVCPVTEDKGQGVFPVISLT